MQIEKTPVGIIGASGYTGSELARILANHPAAKLVAATASGERVGQKLSQLFPSLRGVCDLVLEEMDLDAIAQKCEIVFVALGHGKALDIAPELLKRGVKVIDLGADFRLRDTDVYQEWYHLPHTSPEALQEAVYGLPELHREKIKSARLVANPGCYPTSAILALAPFVAVDAIQPQSIIVDSASGVSGAGRASFGVGTHFPEHSGDFRAYNVASHRHTPEMEQGLSDVVTNTSDKTKQPLLTFTAHLLPVARGILSTCYAMPQGEFADGLNAHDWREILLRFYDGTHSEAAPFVRVLEVGEYPQIKAVNSTNFCDIAVQVDRRTGRLIVISALDNLVKGASGQAIQNMNLMIGCEETAGLWSAAVFP